MGKKHSYVAFYMDAWAGGTARMTRLVRSVFFDVCFHNWDKVEPMSEAAQMLAFDDLGPQAEQIINVLVATGKLIRDSDGSVYNEKAMEEGKRAADLYAKKSGGGKKGAAATNGGGTPAERADAEENRTEETPSEIQRGDSPPLGEGESGEDQNGREEEEEAPPVRKTYDTLKIMGAWNEMAAKHGLAQVTKMTEERRKKTRARLDDYTEAEVLQAIALVPERPFLMGENERGWKANFDFLIRPDSIQKINEGGSYMGSGRRSGWVDQ